MMYPKAQPVRDESYRRLVACTVACCENKQVAKGLCNLHYLRVSAHGSTDLPARKSVTLSDALNAGTKEDPASGCHNWIKSLREGYGRLWFDGQLYSAHVVAYELRNGPVADGLQVNHKCHNRACVNPDHLYAGDQKQNMADMASAGRQRPARGESHPKAKLTESDVLSIYGSDEPSADLARKFSVSESMIRFIRTGQSWSWLTKAHAKEKPLRSEEYRRQVAALECAHCGKPGPSQAAHGDEGKGLGLKSSDLTCYPLCADGPGRQGCHSIIGASGRFSKEHRRILEKRYAAQTRERLGR